MGPQSAGADPGPACYGKGGTLPACTDADLVLGYLDPNFFAGGNQSIRGFAYQSIGNEIDVQKSNGKNKTLVVGGDRLVVASLEYQYYFNENWRGALFVDGGDAFDSGEFELNYGAGFGIHYMTPVGAVRVELANSLSDDNPDWRLHFTVGAEF